MSEPDRESYTIGQLGRTLWNEFRNTKSSPAPRVHATALATRPGTGQRGSGRCRGLAPVLRRCYRPGMGSETIPSRLQDPARAAAAKPPDPAEAAELHAATLELEHLGRRKRVRLRLDPVPATVPAHHRRPDRRVMRLRTESWTGRDILVTSGIPWRTIHFYAMRLLEHEADREAWG